MSVFERTPLGQRNRNLFLRSDLIVYVEGGDESTGVKEGFDILFWSTVFRSCRPELRVRFLPKGGKGTVLELAKTFAGTSATGVCVAVDADYDGLNGSKIIDDHVIYTKGYSFENDVMSPEVLGRAFYIFCPRCPSDLDVVPDIEARLSEFAHDARRLVLADLLAVNAGFSIIDRKRTQKYLTSGAYACDPKLNKNIIVSEIIRRNVKPRSVTRVPPGARIDVIRDAVGHLYAEFCYRVITYLHSLHSIKSKITKDGFMSVCIQAFGDLFVHHPAHDLCVHYRNQLARVPI